MAGKGKKSADPTCPLWMMTFGDCMSLLVTFFVMLISFSSLDQFKLMDMIGALKGALGVVPESTAATDYLLEEPQQRLSGNERKLLWLSAEELSSVIPSLRVEIERFGSPLGPQHPVVTVKMLDEGLAFLVDNRVLFSPGRENRLPDSANYLQPIRRLALNIENEIRVICPVEEAPDETLGLFATGWGLGLARAAKVTGLFTSWGVPEERMASGVADDVIALPADPDLAEGRTAIIVVGKRHLSELPPAQVLMETAWE